MMNYNERLMADKAIEEAKGNAMAFFNDVLGIKLPDIPTALDLYTEGGTTRAYYSKELRKVFVTETGLKKGVKTLSETLVHEYTHYIQLNDLMPNGSVLLTKEEINNDMVDLKNTYYADREIEWEAFLVSALYSYKANGSILVAHSTYLTLRETTKEDRLLEIVSRISDHEFRLMSKAFITRNLELALNTALIKDKDSYIGALIEKGGELQGYINNLDDTALIDGFHTKRGIAGLRLESALVHALAHGDLTKSLDFMEKSVKKIA